MPTWYSKAQADTLLALKATLVSPAFTGTPTIGGVAVAKMSDVTAAVNGVLGGAAGAFDTLKELETALGDDANFAATVTAALAARPDRTELAANYAGAVINVAAHYGITAAAINQALVDANAKASNSFGYRTTVYLDARTWTLEAPIVPQHYVTLTGAGRGRTILQPSGTNPAMKYIGTGDTTRLKNFNFTDVTIDCSQQSGTYTYEIKGVYIMWAYRCEFRRLDINDAYATALGLDYPAGQTIVDLCTFKNAGRGNTGNTGGGGNGFGALMASQDFESVIISNCDAYTCSGFGYLVETQQSPSIVGIGYRITNCLAYNCGSASRGGGFSDGGTTAGIYEGCTAYANVGSGFMLNAGDSQPTGNSPVAAKTRLTGCVSISNLGWGIVYDATVTAPKGVGPAFTNNTVTNNALGGVAILLASTGNLAKLAIRSNEINNNGGTTGSGNRGIYVNSTGTSGLTDVAITDNNLIDNASSGMILDANITGGIIDGNRVADSGAGLTANGLVIKTGRTMNKVTFGINDFADCTTAVGLTGATLTSCSVALIRGWTRVAGVPNLMAPKGTQAQRTDGSAGTLLYVNTDGATTWTAYA